MSVKKERLVNTHIDGNGNRVISATKPMCSDTKYGVGIGMFPSSNGKLIVF